MTARPSIRMSSRKPLALKLSPKARQEDTRGDDADADQGQQGVAKFFLAVLINGDVALRANQLIPVLV
jgi:hypothetical protein